MRKSERNLVPDHRIKQKPGLRRFGFTANKRMVEVGITPLELAVRFLRQRGFSRLHKSRRWFKIADDEQVWYATIELSEKKATVILEREEGESADGQS